MNDRFEFISKQEYEKQKEKDSLKKNDFVAKHEIKKYIKIDKWENGRSLKKIEIRSE